MFWSKKHWNVGLDFLWHQRSFNRSLFKYQINIRVLGPVFVIIPYICFCLYILRYLKFSFSLQVGKQRHRVIKCLAHHMRIDSVDPLFHYEKHKLFNLKRFISLLREHSVLSKATRPTKYISHRQRKNVYSYFQDLVRETISLVLLDALFLLSLILSIFFPILLHGLHLFCGWWQHLRTDPSTENTVAVSVLLHEKYAQHLPCEQKWAYHFSNIQAWGPTAESTSQICCLLLLHSWVSTLRAPATDFIPPPPHFIRLVLLAHADPATCCHGNCYSQSRWW